MPQIIKLAKENGRKLQECNKKLEHFEEVVELYEKCQDELEDMDSNESNSDEETCDKIIESLHDELESLKNKTEECEELRAQNKQLEKRVKSLEQEIKMYKEAASMFNTTEIEIHNALTHCMDENVICSQELRNAEQAVTNLGMENSALQFSKDDCKRYNTACQNDLSQALDYKKTCLRDLTFCNMSLNYCVSRNDLCKKMAILFEANQEDGRINNGRAAYSFGKG
ncbi:hypothetical protein B566_EDAN002775 [Ephemera danica]|nr:hypothetical protein B566_EDAN002775 [Ephemera danica]